MVLAIVCCAVAACLKSKRTTLVEDPEKPLDVSVHIDEESKEGPDDELSASRHAKPIKPVEAVPEKVRAVSFDIEQPVVSPLTESRASASKWSLAKLLLILCCVRAPGATSCRAEPTLRAE